MDARQHNEMIIARIKGVRAQPGTPETDADPLNPNIRKCELCDGTGNLTLLKSWVVADGYRKTRCGNCHGSGHSNHRPDKEYVREQRRLRAAAND